MKLDNGLKLSLVLVGAIFIGFVNVSSSNAEVFTVYIDVLNRQMTRYRKTVNCERTADCEFEAYKTVYSGSSGSEWFPPMEEDERYEFKFWVIGKNLDTNPGEHDFNADLAAGVTEAVAWYSFSRPGPGGTRSVNVRAINISSNEQMNLDFSILADANPSSFLEQCSTTPCTMVDSDNAALESITARYQLSELGYHHDIVVQEGSGFASRRAYTAPTFKNWLLDGNSQDTKTLNLDLQSSHAPIAFYYNKIEIEDQSSPFEIQRISIQGTIYVPVVDEKEITIVNKICQHFPELCSSSEGGRDPSFHCLLNFKDAEYLEISIIDRRKNKTILVAEKTKPGEKRIELSAELLDEVGGMRNLGILIKPTSKAIGKQVIIEVELQKKKREKKP